MIHHMFSGKLWVVNRLGGWHLITLPDNISYEIRSLANEIRPGINSIPAMITIGNTNWKTSIFYEEAFKAYLLPVKGDVRKKEQLFIGDCIKVKLDLII